MTWVDRLRSWFRPRRGRTAVLARYDAAQTNHENAKHWAAADDLSAREANSLAVRIKLRRRARYEVDNNCYAKGIILTLCDDLIGTGPRVQVQTADPDVNKRIEAEFAAWSEAVGLAAKLRTMRHARAQDGEAFAMLVKNPRLPTPAKLDVLTFETDHVSRPTFRATSERECDGIEFDEFGNPLRYFVLKNHPGGGTASLTAEGDWVKAESVLHWFRADRPGQVRGVPEITPALPLYAYLRRYTLASVNAAENAANIAAVIQTTAGTVTEAEEMSERAEIQFERGSAPFLPEGWGANQMKAEQPTTQYPSFKRELLNEIARCLNVPYNVAACNSESYNYASGRLDYQIYFRTLKVDRSHLVRLLNRIFAAWYQETALALRTVLDGLDANAVPQHTWFWDGTEHVDPAKEANAQSTRARTGTTHRAREYANLGLDVDEEDAKAAASYGVTVAEYRRAVFGATFNLPQALAVDDQTADVTEDEDDDADE